MVKAASPIFVKKAARTFRVAFVSRMNLHAALTTAAIAAQSIQNDLFNIHKYRRRQNTFINDGDVFRSRRQERTHSAVSFIGADVIAGVFTREPELRELAVFSIRCMALGLVLDIPLLLFVPMLTAFVMGMQFGSRGITASIVVGKFLQIIRMTITCTPS